LWTPHECRTAGPGDVVMLPKVMPHTWRAYGNDPIRFQVTVTPGEFETFFERIAERKLTLADQAELAEVASAAGMDIVGPRLSDQLRQRLRDSGRLSLVDITPIASEAQASNLQACGGCDIPVGSTHRGRTRHHRHRAEGIESDPQHEHLRSRRFVRSNHCGH